MSDPRRAFAAAAMLSVERWSLPEMDGPIVGRTRDDKRTPAGPDAAVVARQEAEARGYEAGMAKAQAETQSRIAALDARVKQLDTVLQLLGRPLQEMDAQVEIELTQLALAVGKQLARRELKVDPTQVIAIIRESLSQLPAAARDVRVHLHPEDAATVRERLTAPANERVWSIVEDPTLSRGGCVVRTDHSQIDARLETRVQALMSSALGEQRVQDRQPDPGNDSTAPGRA
jgi:flagellar assembly protein FliH